MWFLGLLFGTIIGAFAGGGGGAFLGAIAGVLIGWALSTRSGSSIDPGDERLKAIDEAIRRLSERVSALEGAQPAVSSKAEQPAAAPAASTASDAVAADAASLGIDLSSAVPTTEKTETVAPAPATPPIWVGPSGETRSEIPARPSTAARSQWIGVIVGAVIGLAAGGMGGAVVVGFLGWVIAMIVVANQREDTPSSATGMGAPSRPMDGPSAKPEEPAPPSSGPAHAIPPMEETGTPP
ncbi:MAG TPA: hypothetical protein VEW72_13525, partial [Burkholderiales bacterium]|nr:hypothetical protein [Burkholderiales bacterium]